MKRKLLILIVMMLPLIAMSQGVITRPGKKPAKTAPKQSAPAKKQKPRLQATTDNNLLPLKITAPKTRKHFSIYTT